MLVTKIRAEDNHMTAEFEPGIVDGAELQTILGSNVMLLDKALSKKMLFRHDIGEQPGPIVRLLRAPSQDMNALRHLSQRVRAINFILLGNITQELAGRLLERSIIDLEQIGLAYEIIRMASAMPAEAVAVSSEAQTDPFLQFCADICMQGTILSQSRLDRASKVICAASPARILQFCKPHMPIVPFRETPPDRQADRIEILYQWMTRNADPDTQNFGSVCAALGLEPQNAAVSLMEHVKRRASRP